MLDADVYAARCYAAAYRRCALSAIDFSRYAVIDAAAMPPPDTPRAFHFAASAACHDAEAAALSPPRAIFDVDAMRTMPCRH